jgi:hypothetical protein
MVSFTEWSSDCVVLVHFDDSYLLHLLPKVQSQPRLANLLQISQSPTFQSKLGILVVVLTPMPLLAGVNSDEDALGLMGLILVGVDTSFVVAVVVTFVVAVVVAIDVFARVLDCPLSRPLRELGEGFVWSTIPSSARSALRNSSAYGGQASNHTEGGVELAKGRPSPFAMAPLMSR